MALLSSRTGFPSPPIFPHRNPSTKPRTARSTVAMCESPSSRPPVVGGDNSILKIGSPVIVIDAPATLKTANSITCLKVNGGQVKPGDVGRIVARKPKDVWAVRLSIGTYLIDGKHFKPLDVEGVETVK